MYAARRRLRIPSRKAVLFSLLGGTLLTMAAFGTGYLLVGVPDPNKTAVAQSNVWLYSDGSPIARTGEVHRQSVPLSGISRAAQYATLAAEDRTFYTDSAISPTGIARAVTANLTGGARQGGSTITQQYVKNYYLNQETTLTRKVKELFIAIKVNQKMSKDDILTGYLNTNYYGRGAYGIRAASEAYYGVSPDRLDAAQGAYLATLLNSPGRYDVKQSPQNREKVLARWNYVLDGMVDCGWLTPADRAGMRFPEPRDPVPGNGLGGQAGYLVDAARRYLTEHTSITEAELASGGWTIRTTIDKDRQKELVRAVDKELIARLAPDSRRADQHVRAGAASVDNSSGKVVALYGGPDYLKQFVNDATRRDVQAGSTLKPLVLASALQNHAKDSHGREITPASRYDGNNGARVERSGYSPGNQGGKSYGSITLREATARSVNTVYAQLAEDIGLERVRQTMIDAGLPEDTPELTAIPALPLGVSAPSAVDLAGAYATLADHGNQRTPILVTEAERGGHARSLPEAESKRVLTAQTADTVTDVLRGVIEDPAGTAPTVKALGRPAAGKTGTTNERKAVWFVGYTPQLTTSVRVFREDPDSHAQLAMENLGGQPASGGNIPARVWTEYMGAALKGQPVEQFRTPERSSDDPVKERTPTEQTQKTEEPPPPTPTQPSSPPPPVTDPSPEPDSDTSPPVWPPHQGDPGLPDPTPPPDDPSFEDPDQGGGQLDPPSGNRGRGGEGGRTRG
ncbi:transglycosylase domain-containing protein [Streptomyces vinaceus]|uniref:transglycosylase domain-containing protein n=1 Tax=Streptomyces vinaceus TaxID=1960 RepID=UPI00381D7AD5